MFKYIMIYINNMAEIIARVRKWRDSLVIIIPKNIAKEENLSDVFGILKNKIKKNAQDLKDEARKGWR